MISKIQYKSGATLQSPLLEAAATSITVFVGPNNAGKSLALSEIERWGTHNRLNGSEKIISAVEPEYLTRGEVSQEIDKFNESKEKGTHLKEHMGDMNGLWKSALSPNDYAAYAAEHQILPPAPPTRLANGSLSYYEAWSTAYEALRSGYTVRLASENRLSLLDEQPLGDLQKAFAPNFLSALFRDDNLRSRVRKVVFSAINKYFVIDPTDAGNLRVRLSDFPVQQEEKTLSNDAIAFHKAALLVKEFSHGIRAFVGIIARLISTSSKIILIDEPEAFLHPALAMKLGKEIGQWAQADRLMRLFASTHSAAFIMGCLQSGSPISIVRLTYKDGIGTTRILESKNLLHLMRNPLLRSLGVIEGLFYDAVIVAESDADRAFYQEINERLRSANDPRGMNNCLFLNAQSKQTVWDIVKPLREMGIPAIGIVDLDMVKDGGAEFGKIVSNNFIPNSQLVSLGIHRASVKDTLDATVPILPLSGDSKKDTEAKNNYWKRNGGLALLSNDDKQSAFNFFEQLERYGIFVVTVGELEDWLKYLNVPKGNKKAWLPTIFMKMGEDPAHIDYVHPRKDDVWEFIGRISAWANNHSRLGIPS